jgi:hypothetical protein
MPPAFGDARYALIVAVSAYSDDGLTDLAAPARDAEDLAAVLRRPDVGDFRDVQVLLDPDHATAQHRIESFFARRDPLDIAVLHFSGHAFRGEHHDDLFLAMRDTSRDSPLATSVPGAFLRMVIEKSRARRKLLLLDCCHSGALTLTRDLGRPGAVTPGERTRAAEVFKAGVQRIAPEASQPQSNATGTVIIGAARATELARETHTGALTGALVEGLATGDADRNRTGKISTENLFEYVTEWFQRRDLHQHPVVQQRSRSGQFIVAENCAFQPIALPGDLESLLLDPDPAERVRAVHRLRPLALAADHDIAETAFRRLQHLEQFDFDDQVTTAAHLALHRMAPAADPGHLDFGTVRRGAPVAVRPVRILAPPPARGWTARPPADAAVSVSRHDDRLEVALHTGRPGRVDTRIAVDSVAGTTEVRVTARIHRPPPATMLAAWYRDRHARPGARPGPRDRGTGVPRVPAGGRRLLTAVLAGLLVALLLTSFRVLPSATVLGACFPRDDLRVLTTDALRDAIDAAAAGFAGRSPGDACPDLRVTVSSVTSDGVAQRQFAQQWPDADLRVAGPSPDVWLPESSFQVGLAREAIPADAPHRLDLPADPAAASVASSPLVLAASATVTPAKPVSREQVLAGDWTIPRADPRNSSAGLLATYALYGPGDNRDPRTAEAVLERGQGGDDARYDLCTHRLATSAPPAQTAFLVPRKYVTDYREGKPLGAACQANQKPPLNRGLHVRPVTGAPGLDVPCVPIQESAWGDDRQRKLAADFCAYLRGDDGQRILGEHGLEPPDPAAVDRNPGTAAATGVIRDWSADQRPVRMLLVVDVSGSMRLPMPGARVTRIQAIKAAAKRAVTGRSLDRTDQVGLWEFATRLDGRRDYRERLALSAATAEQQIRLTTALDRLAPTDRDTGLYDTIHAGIDRLRRDRPADTEFPPVDLLVVLTDGENDDAGSVDVPQIGARLRGSGVQVAVIASVGANCRTFQPLVAQGLSCFDENRGGLDAAFDQALPSRRAAR